MAKKLFTMTWLILLMFLYGCGDSRLEKVRIIDGTWICKNAAGADLYTSPTIEFDTKNGRMNALIGSPTFHNKGIKALPGRDRLLTKSSSNKWGLFFFPLLCYWNL